MPPLEPHGRSLVILNPHGVSLSRSDVRSDLQRIQAHPSVELVETEYAGHAGDVCRNRARDFDKVIAVGGDGLLMDVVNGVIDSDVAIAPFPAGTGSDFVKAAPNYPASLDRLLASKESVHVDLGEVTFNDDSTQRFLTEAGVGLDAACLRYVPAWLRPISSKRAYDVGALRAVFFARPFDATLFLDGQPAELHRFQWIAVSNTRYSGDGMPLSPHAEIDDGRLHVFALGDVSRVRILGNFFSIRRGEHIHHPDGLYRPAHEIQLETEAKLDMCFDGDLIQRTPCRWRILPNQLRLVVPTPMEARAADR